MLPRIEFQVDVLADDAADLQVAPAVGDLGPGLLAQVFGGNVVDVELIVGEAVDGRGAVGPVRLEVPVNVGARDLRSEHRAADPQIRRLDGVPLDGDGIELHRLDLSQAAGL